MHGTYSIKIGDTCLCRLKNNMKLVFAEIGCGIGIGFNCPGIGLSGEILWTLLTSKPR